MSTEAEIRSIPRKATRGAEPLRRTRVEPAPLISAPWRRKAINIVLGFAAAVLMIDALVGEKGLLEGLRARRAYDEAEASLNALKAENARLRDRMRRLNEDRSAVEALAREELGYIRPGEVLFIIRDAPSARTSSGR